MKIKLSIFLSIIFNIFILPQYIPSPGNKISSILENISIKHNISYHYFDRYYFRKTFDTLLITIDNLRLTPLEKEEVSFYKKEYSGVKEDKKFTFFSKDVNDRLRVFGYKDNFFSIYLDPILGYEVRSIKGELVKHRFNGFSVYGSLGNNFGFDVMYWDNEESGKYVDTFKYISRIRGNNLVKVTKDAIEYDESIVNLYYSWDWGSVAVGKNYFEWGSGRNGQIILSNKAPAFPYFKLDIYPVDWFSFTYLHGWLHSMIIDSSTYRYPSVLNRATYSQVNKYIAAHYFNVKPYNNFSFTLGESVIYSNEIEYMYLIPIMFFRAVDHYMQGEGNTGDNMQIFADANYVVPEIKSRFYGTIFIDELSVSDLLKGGNLSTIAYTLGGKVVDPLLNNSSFLIEFTQLAPFTYMNSDITQTFRSRGYQLGHWIGSNSKQIYVEYEQRIIRGLCIKFFGEYDISGQKENPEDQYRYPYPKTLYGPKRKAIRFGIDVDYELIHTLKANLDYQYSNITDEDSTRTLEWQLGKNHYLSFGLSYGF